MRLPPHLAIALAGFGVAASPTVIRADATLPSAVGDEGGRAGHARLRKPHTPLGPRCDEALGRAQLQFTQWTPQIDFHVTELALVGEYDWADQCGVWGRYEIRLEPDDRRAHGWRWQTRTSAGEEERRHGARVAHGWRAAILVDGDSGGEPMDRFVDAFQPALDECLASAAR